MHSRSLVGQTLGKRYEIEQLLGKGGMGEVWLTWDKVEERLIAIKFVLSNFLLLSKQKEYFNQKLKEEARIAQNLDHPNILKVYGVEILQDGHFCLVMEYADDGTLEDRVIKENFTFEDIRQIMHQICAAIHYTHGLSEQVIHRDLKPSNILFNKEDKVLITDFGLAKILREATHVSTQPGQGTEDYMAPEQRFSKNLRPQCDIYALGAILQTMFVGTPPKQELTGTTIKIILSDEPPVYFAEVVEKATKVDYTERYQTANELVKSLDSAFNKFHEDFARKVIATIQLGDVTDGRNFDVNDMIVLQDDKRGHIDAVSSISFNSTGSLLASASADSNVLLWGATAIQQIPPLKHCRAVRCVAFNPTGDVLATGGEDNKIRLWKVENGREIQKITGHTDVIANFIFHPSGEFLASESYDGTIILWNISTLQQITKWEKSSDWSGGIAFNSTGELIASGDKQGIIHIWNIKDGKEFFRLEGHEDSVTDIAFSPNGKLLGSSSIDGSIRLWNIENKTETQILYGHQDSVLCLAFNPNGHYLVSGSEDTDILLWNIKTGQQLQVLNGHLHAVQNVVFHPNKAFLASASKDSTIRIWKLNRTV